MTKAINCNACGAVTFYSTELGSYTVCAECEQDFAQNINPDKHLLQIAIKALKAIAQPIAYQRRNTARNALKALGCQDCEEIFKENV